MADSNDFEWLTRLKISADREEAEKIQNGKSWIENAKTMRLQEWADMLKDMKPMDIWENGAPGFREEYNQRQPAVILYPGKKNGSPRGSVLISAGGGFLFKSVWEAKPIAQKFYDAGFTSFIMDYRVQPYEMKYSEMDVMRAIKFIRYNAAEFNVKPDKIAVLGGSAGAILSAAAAVKFDYGIANHDDPVEQVSSRPDVVIMSYGARTLTDVLTPLATSFSYEEQKKTSSESVEHNIRHDSPPFFIWQTIADDPRYSCNFGNVLTARGIPFELHIFPEGPHGCGLADGNHRFAPYCRSTARWSQMVAEFLENCGF
jgi:acetyl esterase/lipase